jgi:CheY-like chemotaxis protein
LPSATELLSSEGDPTRRSEYFEHLRGAVDHLGTLADDILDFHKLSAGHVEMRNDTFTPEQTLRGVVSLFDPRAESMGLGLPICRKIVEAMGGSIDFDSTPGQGSRFWFTVPTLRIPPQLVTVPRTNDDAEPSMTLRALLAEDEKANALIDVHMPETDGIGVIRQIRRLEAELGRDLGLYAGTDLVNSVD